MHQVSLVQHLAANTNLRKALIGDEVGIGKTIEAGLFLKILFSQHPRMRALYLAPARLVGNVVGEFRDKLDLDARRWTAGITGDARLESDRLVVASINKAVFGENLDRVVSSGPWDVLIVDECHHLSDWDPEGGSPNQAFKLVQKLMGRMPSDGRVLFLSGTPHQGSEARFRNLLRLLSDDGKDFRTAAGRDLSHEGPRPGLARQAPVPGREVRQPTVVRLGPAYEQWYEGISTLYERRSGNSSATRAAGWAKGQALQWAASSVQAGLGFLARLGIRRLNWTPRKRALEAALSALRPYRGGSRDEPVLGLYERLLRQIGKARIVGDVLGDVEEDDEGVWRPDSTLLSNLLEEGVSLLATDAADAKWLALNQIIDAAEGEKIVLFAQPVETVATVANFLKKHYGQEPAIVIGNQDEDERKAQVASFQSDAGPRFLVSSRAGGEGLNMQRSRRLIHFDVPWNPMELEQRIGRVHRFGSRRTVIVDTVVAAGSREVHMYRIAREKLKLIVAHLDPEQFEALFSRVMSLVPPREFEDLLGNVGGEPFPAVAADEIGRLVTEGYRSWNEFDQRFRGEAERIRSVSPGEATWSDLAQFLLHFADAEVGPDVNVSAFDFRDDEIGLSRREASSNPPGAVDCMPAAIPADCNQSRLTDVRCIRSALICRKSLALSNVLSCRTSLAVQPICVDHPSWQTLEGLPQLQVCLRSCGRRYARSRAPRSRRRIPFTSLPCPQRAPRRNWKQRIEPVRSALASVLFACASRQCRALRSGWLNWNTSWARSCAYRPRRRLVKVSGTSSGRSPRSF